MEEHIERQCLGSPLLAHISVKSIVDAITINQGYIVQGERMEAFVPLLDDVLRMMKTERSELRHSSLATRT